MADQKLILTQEQSDIVHAGLDQTMLIVAGAGSGKTFTMTQRIIELIREGIEPQKILGLTFTKAAATELLTRVSAAVSKERATSGNGDAEAGDTDEAVDTSFMKPEVYTYDAFFQSIVRQYGLLVGVDPNATPLSEAGAYQLMSDVIHEEIERVGLANAADDDEESEKIRLEDIGTFSTFASNVLNLAEAIGSSVIDGTCTSMDEAIDRVESWDASFIAHLDSIVKKEYPEERELADFGKEAKDLTAAARKTVKSFEKWMNDKGRDYLAHFLIELRESTRMRSVYLRFVRLFVAQKRELRMAQFSDFTIATMQLVQRFPWIGEQYRARFSHVFLDEYQDSSSVQASLIVQLFAPSGALREENVSLTAVGDPYQALYAWRGAAPGAFATFLKDVPLAKELSLSASMRNSRLVLDTANELTAPLRRGHVDKYGRRGSIKLGEVSVKKLSVHETESRPAAAGSVAAVAYATAKQERDGVVRYAQAAVAKSKAENAARETAGKPRKDGPYVAVLLRTKMHMAEYAEALQKAGLRVQMDGVSSLLERPDAKDLLHTLRAVADHSDSVSVLNLLASTRFGLSAADLQAFSDTVTAYNKRVQKRLLDTVGMEAPSRESDDAWKIQPVISLADVLLMDGPAREKILTSGRISAAGLAQIMRCGDALARVNAAVVSGLESVLRTAGCALGLDVDVAVAYGLTRTVQSVRQSVRQSAQREKAEKSGEVSAAASAAAATVRDALPVSSVDSFIDLAQSYTTELAEGQKPTLAGFLSWVDGGKTSGADGVTDPTIIGSAHADVLLCTIHHSKGLEWDSVIIPAMNGDTFPSGRKPSLKIIDPDPKEGGYESDGSYVATARTWLTESTAVPYPVHAQSDALYGFAADKDEFEHFVPDARSLERVIDGNLRCDEDELPNAMCLREESAQVILEEERRLIYVAVTRARRDVFMTSSCAQNDPLTDAYEPVRYTPADASRPADSKCQKVAPSQVSAFWKEAYTYLKGLEGAVCVETESLDDSPLGVFAGQDAAEYAAATVQAAFDASETAVPAVASAEFAHPRSIHPHLSTPLQQTARLVSDETLTDTGEAGSLREIAERAAATAVSLGLAHSSSAHEQRESIFERARRIESERHTSVTRVQRELVEGRDDDYIRSRAIVRPVPNLALYDSTRGAGEGSAADRGTQFHAFAERYLKAESLEAREVLLSDAFEDTQMEEWRQRFVSAPFDPDVCEGAEIPFAYAPSGLDADERPARTVVGVIDAVFAGALVPDSPLAAAAAARGREIRYTVIDWKTGHRPVSDAEVDAKLLQVDMYREIYATLRGVSIDEVDAALYYVSEPDPEKRTISARVKSRDEIESLLRADVSTVLTMREG
ncbi:UvrD-helicase domain-containing protein [Alloscardovia macacae]|uniref:DNA 3'-5' helicase n=1 Tax=Alloscardovia macacae TaxID=1160091 RepID=A0A261F540_9BIFI|nr:UvrD-helicase domain-containing protein [Alloscardovia macacae]OZG54232.1 UvrD/REP helicase [Alloscardovia macacae]